MNKFFILLLLGLFLWPAVSEARDNLSDLEKKSIVKIDVFRNEGDREPTQQGTGFFIDYQGCVITTAHTVYNHTNPELDDLKYIRMYVAGSIKKEPTEYWVGKIEYLDKGKDIAIVCAQNAGGGFFVPLRILNDADYEKLKIGDELSIAGYPAVGGRTPTFVSGEVIGFWQDPDLEAFLKLSFFDSTQIELVKTGALTGPGGSGSPAVDMHHQVIGMVFAASMSPSGVSFLVSSKTMRVSLGGYREQKIKEFGCAYDVKSGLYQKNGSNFYDNKCEAKRDLNTEQIVKLNYQDRCGGEISLVDLHEASSYIVSGVSSVDLWWNYLKDLCPIKSAEASLQFSGKENSGVKAGLAVYAYGKERTGTSIEDSALKLLKAELRKSLGTAMFNKIGEKQWIVLVKAYVYGGYPVKAISQSVKWGGYTVHPAISYSVWQGSGDYKRYINK